MVSNLLKPCLTCRDILKQQCSSLHMGKIRYILHNYTTLYETLTITLQPVLLLTNTPCSNSLVIWSYFLTDNTVMPEHGIPVLGGPSLCMAISDPKTEKLVPQCPGLEDDLTTLSLPKMIKLACAGEN